MGCTLEWAGLVRDSGRQEPRSWHAAASWSIFSLPSPLSAGFQGSWQRVGTPPPALPPVLGIQAMNFKQSRAMDALDSRWREPDRRRRALPEGYYQHEDAVEWGPPPPANWKPGRSASRPVVARRGGGDLAAHRPDPDDELQRQIERRQAEDAAKRQAKLAKNHDFGLRYTSGPLFVSLLQVQREGTRHLQPPPKYDH